MFDISWTEFLLIGIVALIVIGPKELPAVMRTMGQWMRKVRSMASDFQNQFHEAMREAEMADLKKEVDDMARDIRSYDPLKEVRADVEAIGKDIESSAKPQPAAEVPISEAASQLRDENVVGTGSGPVAPEAAEMPDAQLASPGAPTEPTELKTTEVVGAGTGPAEPESAGKVAQPEGAERTG